MSDADLILETLAAEQKLQGKIEERKRDLETMRVVLQGIRRNSDKKLYPQLRVFLDKHREQRRLSLPNRHCMAQVAWIYFDGRITWLRGYAWTFDEDNKSFGPGRLTEQEQEKIVQLAEAELERIGPQLQKEIEQQGLAV